MSPHLPNPPDYYATSSSLGNWRDPEPDETGHMVIGRPWDRVMSRGLVEVLLNEFPLEGETDMRFLVSTMRTMRWGEPDQRIVFPRRTVAACLGIPKDRCRGENAAGKRLDDFAARVLPESKRIEYRYTLGEANALADVYAAVGEDLLDLLGKDKEKSFKEQEWVYPRWSINKRKITPKRRNEVTNRKKEYAEDSLDLNKEVKTKRRLIEYLHSHHKNSFVIRDRDERHKSARAVLDEYPDGTKKERQAKRKLSADLKDVINDPFPLYRPSRKAGGSARLTPWHPSLASIPKKMRRALQPDWIELDLAHAHLAIAATEWNVDALTEALTESLEEEKASIWKRLHQYTGCSKYGIDLEEAKGGFKKAVYALLYGAAPKNVYKAIIEEYNKIKSPDDPDLPKEVLNRFGDHDFIQELYSAREARIKEMRHSDVVEDVFGRRLQYDPDEHAEIRSVLAKLAQSIELLLLEPVVQWAVKEKRSKKKPRFKILLWQHDGFSFRPSQSRDEELWIRRLKKCVDEANTKYPTHLEVDFPQQLAD